jgi:DNA-binding GntR family transcriptional regulator
VDRLAPIVVGAYNDPVIVECYVDPPTMSSARAPADPVASRRSSKAADPSPALTQGERAYRRIRADIVFGRLAPGHRLTLERLREQYETSVGTLRELLSRLASEGLVTAEAARGFEVAPVSVANLREIASMRTLLEGHALRESFTTGDMDWEGRVVAAHHKLAAMEKRMATGDRGIAELWKRYDSEFHHALISACGSEVLLATHASIYDKYLRYQMVVGLYRGEVASREHRRLLEYAMTRDWHAAQKALDKHVHDCVDHILSAGLLERRLAS